MPKPHCPDCDSIFTGDSCRCVTGKKPRKLKCKCGEPAAEIYVDRLGEWPLCEACLELASDEFATMPLPSDSSKRGNKTEPSSKDKKSTKHKRSRRKAKSKTRLSIPFELSKREFEVAQLYHLPNEKIAEKLFISEATVKSHYKSIHKKMKIHSRYEIPYLLKEEKSETVKSQDSQGPFQFDMIPRIKNGITNVRKFLSGLNL
jgi:DNA-binding CsgD family transcriptional regulator